MLTKEIGKVFTRCHVLNRIIQNKCNDVVNVHGVVDESRHSSWTGFPSEFGNLQEHNIRERGECVQHHSKIHEKKHSEEILKVRGLFITIMDEIDIGKRSSDQMGEGKSLRLR